MKLTEKNLLCNCCNLCIKDNENHYCNKIPKTTSKHCFNNIWNKIINHTRTNNNIKATTCEIPNLTETHL